MGSSSLLSFGLKPSSHAAAAADGDGPAGTEDAPGVEDCSGVVGVDPAVVPACVVSPAPPLPRPGCVVVPACGVRLSWVKAKAMPASDNTARIATIFRMVDRRDDRRPG